MKLSVIVPGYNNQIPWWERCLTSIDRAAQHHPSWQYEIIAVDDCSTDASPTWLDQHVHTFATPTQVLHLSPNRGLAGARNAALEIATGDYITFVDSDDELDAETFSHVLTDSHPDIWLYGVKVIWPEDGLAKIDLPGPSNPHLPSPDEILTLHRQCLLNYAWNKIYRKDFLNSHGIRFNHEGMPCEDIIFNLNCLMAGARFQTVPFAGYIYYRTRGTLLSKYKKTNDVGTRLATETWHKYKESTPGARETMGPLGEINKTQLTANDWRNLWMPGSPFSLKERYHWHREHYQCSSLYTLKAMLTMAIFTFLRRHCYIRVVRRWNTKRNYPQSFNIA